jgi:thermolysin/neutral peptidase B
VYSSKQTYNLPGWIVAQKKNDTSKEGLCKCVSTCWDNTQKVLEFYKNVLKFDLSNCYHGQIVSSLDVGLNFNNAFFNGQQMAYGTGDGYPYNCLR